MIRCLAIDDEPLALKQLESYIEKVSFFELVASCQSAIQAGKVLQDEHVDVMFIDINMPDLNGLDFVKGLPAPPMLVFTTAYSQYAVEGYKVDAVDYLLKPFGLNDFMRAANKVKKQYDIQTAVSSISGPDTDDALFFKTEYKIVRVEIDKIRYIEGMSEYLKIYLDGEPVPIVVLLSMKKLEERLPSDKFIRIHRSYIINLQKIKEVTKGHVLLDQNLSLPIGDLYKDSFQSYLDTKFLGK